MTEHGTSRSSDTFREREVRLYVEVTVLADASTAFGARAVHEV